MAQRATIGILNRELVHRPAQMGVGRAFGRSLTGATCLRSAGHLRGGELSVRLAGAPGCPVDPAQELALSTAIDSSRRESSRDEASVVVNPRAPLALILLCQCGEVVDDDRVELAGEVALQAADDLSV